MAGEGTWIYFLRAFGCPQLQQSVLRDLQLKGTGSHRLAVLIHWLPRFTTDKTGCILILRGKKLLNVLLSAFQLVVVLLLQQLVSLIPLVDIEVPALNRASNHLLRHCSEISFRLRAGRVLNFVNQ